jgi:hypothetical protein
VPQRVLGRFPGVVVDDVQGYVFVDSLHFPERDIMMAWLHDQGWTDII